MPSGEETHAARPDKQAQDDERNTGQNLAPDRSDDPGDDEHDRNEPQKECHTGGLPRDERRIAASSAPLRTCDGH